MFREKQEQPASVPAKATQAGEVRARWSWTEGSVWTDRMLATLETGVKGGKWFSLIDKVYAMTNLHAAYARVARNGGAAGVDHVSTKHFARHLEDELSNQPSIGEHLSRRAGSLDGRTWLGDGALRG